jgi:hypothetical protein
MKYDWRDFAIIFTIFVIAYLLMAPMTSRADPVAPPGPAPASRCHPTAIDSKVACKDVYPDYPALGDMIDEGARKYCCKPN